MVDDEKRDEDHGACPSVPLDQSDQHKHLDLVQMVIARLANNSTLIKGWALTVSVALFGYALVHLSWSTAILGLVPSLGFWFLDSYYLRHERMFRCLHEDVALGRVRGFSLNTEGYRNEISWWGVFRSITLAGFYGMIVAVAVAIVIITAGFDTHVEYRPTPDLSSLDYRALLGAKYPQ